MHITSCLHSVSDPEGFSFRGWTSMICYMRHEKGGSSQTSAIVTSYVATLLHKFCSAALIPSSKLCLPASTINVAHASPPASNMAAKARDFAAGCIGAPLHILYKTLPSRVSALHMLPI